MRQFLQRFRTELFTFIVSLPSEVRGEAFNRLPDFRRLDWMHAPELSPDALGLPAAKVRLVPFRAQDFARARFPEALRGRLVRL
jgi:hypothetical protein